MSCPRECLEEDEALLLLEDAYGGRLLAILSIALSSLLRPAAGLLAVPFIALSGQEEGEGKRRVEVVASFSRSTDRRLGQGRDKPGRQSGSQGRDERQESCRCPALRCVCSFVHPLARQLPLRPPTLTHPHAPTLQRTHDKFTRQSRGRYPCPCAVCDMYTYYSDGPLLSPGATDRYDVCSRPASLGTGSSLMLLSVLAALASPSCSRFLFLAASISWDVAVGFGEARSCDIVAEKMPLFDTPGGAYCPPNRWVRTEASDRCRACPREGDRRTAEALGLAAG